MKIKTINIPVINLRQEFECHLALFRTGSFKDAVYNCKNIPVELSSFSWNGAPDQLLTFMLQRAILGLESYICAAVSYEAPIRLGASHESIEKVERPYCLGKNVFSIFYKNLPGLMGQEFQLSAYSQDTFSALKELYRSVRNPIFHGHQVSCRAGAYEGVVEAFELLSSVYSWIDGWFRALPAYYKGAHR